MSIKSILVTPDVTAATVSATVSAENNWTADFVVEPEDLISVSVIGTSFTGTVVLQRKLTGQASYYDVPNPDGTVGWTSKDMQTTYVADEAATLRLGVKTGGFAGTSVLVRLGKG